MLNLWEMIPSISFVGLHAQSAYSAWWRAGLGSWRRAWTFGISRQLRRFVPTTVTNQLSIYGEQSFWTFFFPPYSVTVWGFWNCTLMQLIPLQVIIACCVLNNIALDLREKEFPHRREQKDPLPPLPRPLNEAAIEVSGRAYRDSILRLFWSG